MEYAKTTQVPIERSKMEIERTLMRYGAHDFAYRNDGKRAIIMFAVNQRAVRFTLPLPPMEGFSQGKKKSYSQEQTFNRWEQACRERWRALSLVIKAKLEAVATGITVFDEEFLAHIITASGKTIGERILPELETSIKRAASLPLLPGA